MSKISLELSAPKIHCDACKKLILMAFEDFPATENITVDLIGKTIRCDYDNTRVSDSEIMAHIETETGFTTVKIR